MMNIKSTLKCVCLYEELSLSSKTAKWLLHLQNSEIFFSFEKVEVRKLKNFEKQLLLF